MSELVGRPVVRWAAGVDRRPPGVGEALFSWADHGFDVLNDVVRRSLENLGKHDKKKRRHGRRKQTREQEMDEARRWLDPMKVKYNEVLYLRHDYV